MSHKNGCYLVIMTFISLSHLSNYNELLAIWTSVKNDVQINQSMSTLHLGVEIKEI